MTKELKRLKIGHDGVLRTGKDDRKVVAEVAGPPCLILFVPNPCEIGPRDAEILHSTVQTLYENGEPQRYFGRDVDAYLPVPFHRNNELDRHASHYFIETGGERVVPIVYFQLKPEDKK